MSTDWPTAEAPEPFAVDPFGATADPARYVARAASERALTQLEVGLSSPAHGAVLEGPPGIGKTFLLRVLGEQLSENWQAVYLPYAALDPTSFASWALEALGLTLGDDARATFLAACKQRNATGARPIALLIDDAEHLPSDTEGWLCEQLLAARGGLGLVICVTLPEPVPERDEANSVAGSDAADTEARDRDAASQAGNDAVPDAASAEGSALSEFLRVRYDEPLSADEARQLLESSLSAAGADDATVERCSAEAARLCDASGGIPAALGEGAYHWLRSDASRAAPIFGEGGVEASGATAAQARVDWSDDELLAAATGESRRQREAGLDVRPVAQPGGGDPNLLRRVGFGVLGVLGLLLLAAGVAWFAAGGGPPSVPASRVSQTPATDRAAQIGQLPRAGDAAPALGDREGAAAEVAPRPSAPDESAPPPRATPARGEVIAEVAPAEALVAGEAKATGGIAGPAPSASGPSTGGRSNSTAASAPVPLPAPETRPREATTIAAAEVEREPAPTKRSEADPRDPPPGDSGAPPASRAAPEVATSVSVDAAAGAASDALDLGPPRAGERPPPEIAIGPPRPSVYSLEITATSKARIELDGRPIGSTPLQSLLVTGGPHRFEVFWPSGEREARDLEVGRNTPQIHFELQAEGERQPEPEPEPESEAEQGGAGAASIERAPDDPGTSAQGGSPPAAF